MLIASYNPAGMGDNLIVLTNNQTESFHINHQGNVIQFITDNSELIGYNFINISETLDLSNVSGQVFLSKEQVAELNKLIEKSGFSEKLVVDEDPKFVVGYVETAEPHPDSDHLQVTTTVIDNDQRVQIVSGSPNMQQGIKVVVAKVGAMMPSGLIIWPGELRGVASNGMISSGRELHLPNAPQVPGALILPDDFAPVGTPFDVNSAAAQSLFE
ncbi:Phenylalanyl-tRNA synthetase domain protein [Weissella jogaejeotgali]|uniref:Phenylalanyl-tRNA synthetase domain protein n=2 Tax=Weissella TaxID=46255 RepID=A0A1L6RBE8_9LACO|nr:DUF4479 and tRNA-binding domain-containing protein [Weissella jogaejeotgali]APS41874.1 Phenylalanyl-tRNA synthetase domain protein [Weissella jogaejeotgali]CCC56302.1 phenylalanine--tRNA ligase beta subunit [Weissella thailandensis fsh4-2]